MHFVLVGSELLWFFSFAVIFSFAVLLCFVFLFACDFFFFCFFLTMFPLVHFRLMKEFFILGDVIVLGKNDVFKFNYPTEAAKMREKRRSGLLVTVSICTIGVRERSAISKNYDPVFPFLLLISCFLFRRNPQSL